MNQKNKTQSNTDRNNAVKDREVVFNSVHDLIIILDIDNRILDANPAVFEATGLREDQVIGRRCYSIFHCAEKSPCDCPYEKLKISLHHESFTMEMEALGRKYLVTVSPVFDDENGQVTRVVHIAKDITDLKITETALKSSEKKFQGIFQTASDGILLADIGNKKFVDANDAICEMLGYTRDEILQLDVSEIHPPGDLPRVMAVFEKQARGEAVVAPELPVKRKDGSVFYAEISSRAMTLDEQPCLIGIFRDITERKRAEQKKAELEKQLRQVYKMEAIGVMAGGIAHDFNNILAIILGNTEMAVNTISPVNPARQNIEEVLKAAVRGKDLVRQILAFSRKEKSEFVAIHPQSIINETLQFLRSTIPTTVSIVKEIAQDCAPIMADPTQLHQLLINLFTNAVHAMDEKGVVTVGLREINLNGQDLTHKPGLSPGTYACISISDTGTGMNQATMARIFDPFYTTKVVGQGTGMGLSIVHGIVESHGGFISVDSGLGRGSTFRVFFPVTEESHGGESRNDETAMQPVTGMKRVLFVDDEESLLLLGQRMLESVGCEVVAESNSEKALEIFKANPGQFDLIVTDQSMPNMSGSELVEEVLRVHPGMPIILCTGYSSKISENNAKEKGISRYIAKPYGYKELAKAVREALDEKSRE